MKKTVVFLLLSPIFTHAMNWWPEPKEERIKARQERAQKEKQCIKATQKLRELIGPCQDYRTVSYWKSYKVKCLIRNGADVDAQSYPGQSPLTWATQAGFLDIIELLIQRGVDLNAPDKYGETALREIRYRNDSIHNKLIKFLLDAGVDPNPIPSYHGWETPLMLSLHWKNETAAGYLIDAGADLDAKAGFGKHALWLAVALYLHHAIKCLLQAGANPNLKDYFGRTALFEAVNNNDEIAVSLLLENRADIRIRTDKGQTALDIARSKGNKKIIQLLENPPPPKSLRKLL
jgi:ankyrin repeat protein